ncbi:MAG TPA: hypothetical protein VFS98_11120 [Methylomirabilota bacterium]|jgi:hypothetical protein|nr:hypothetical protein [Methylomirabilota bacterium]
MRIPPILLVMVLTIVPLASAQPAAEWLTGQTGRGTARWSRQNGGLTYQGGAPFGWAVLKGTSLRDGWAETRFKPVDGRQDRAGGVVWRWLDADNYYVARGNALEDNVVAYKVVKGRRTDLTPVGMPPGTYGVKAPVAAGAWHTLRVDCAGSEFAITYDGRRLFTVHDETFPGPGAVGVWSKADSITEFQNFNYEGKS